MAVATEQPQAAASQPAPTAGNASDTLFRILCTGAAVLVVLLALLLIAVVTWKSWLSIQTTGLSFFTGVNWDPEPDHRQFQALAFIYGTLVTSAIAMLIAVPLGVGSAAFLSEIAPAWVRRIGSFLVEMLAAIPSVVYGLWGMYMLAPLLQEWITAWGGPNTGGRNVLTASIVLSIMVVPYVTAVSFDVCRAVPASQRQAALALGATRWQSIWTAVLPYARPGIMAACFIALGRALGETMAITMLIGNTDSIPLTPFQSGDSIASKIANQFNEATYELFRSALMELGLVLLLVTLVTNGLARFLIWRMGLPGSRRSLVDRLFRRGLPSGKDAPASQAPRQPLPATSRRARQVDRLMTGVMGACLAATVGPLFFILGYLLYKGVVSLDWDFFTKVQVPVGEPGGGMAHALAGSAMLVGMAFLMAVPIGLLAAIYLAEYRNGKLAHLVRFTGEMLTGVPSIVIGIFTYQVVVLPMIYLTDKSVRLSGWAGAFALGVMMIPIVMRASEEALKLVPKAIRTASMALGANHWQTILRITVPAALPAIITAISLAIARVAGETAPLLMTAGENRDFALSPNDPTPSVPVLIFNYSKLPYPDWQRKAWAAALVLMVVVLLLNFGIRKLTGKRVVLAARAD